MKIFNELQRIRRNFPLSCCRVPRGQRGFGLLDVMMGAMILSVCWLVCWQVQEWVHRKMITHQLLLEAVLQIQGQIERSRYEKISEQGKSFDLPSRLFPKVIYHMHCFQQRVGMKGWRTIVEARWIDPAMGPQFFSLKLEGEETESKGDSSSLRPSMPSG